MQQTPNYALKKIDLTDSPPDITVLNQNFDTIDQKLKENGDGLTSHLAETVTDPDGVHGLKIEEGDWTPILKGLTTAGANTYSTQYGVYYKTGKQVICNFVIALSAKDLSMAGHVVIDGFPFSLVSAQGVSIGGISNIDFTSGKLGTLLRPSGNLIYLTEYGDNVSYNIIQSSAIQNTTEIKGQIIYLTTN